MTALYFYGRNRAAALHILANTPLGEALRMWGETHDGGNYVQLSLDVAGFRALSRGERQLWRFVASLAGNTIVILADLFAAIDDDCTTAVIEAVGIAAGTREVASS
jgi:hypothetical protein